MLFKNAYIFQPDGEFHFGAFRVENGKFKEVFESIPEEDGVDLEQQYVIPGVMDIHSHGNSGCDFSNGVPEETETMLKYYGKNGVTAVTPASMTVSEDMLNQAYRVARQFYDRRPQDGARLMGINMEGPFFSYNKRGAQNPDYLLNPSYEVFQRLNEASGGIIRFVDVAPELPGAMEFIEKAKKHCTVSVAHTEADYDLASSAFEAGATHLTHLFNAMNGIHHRKPGPVAAGAERENVFAELICDGQHIHPSVVRLAFKLFPGRICIISDSLACCGLPEGEYDSGGMKVYLKDNVCRLADGTIAGSVCHAYQGMLNAIAFGVPQSEAILAATRNPAIQAGCYNKLGSIEAEKFADFVVCNEKLERQAVYINGEEI